MPQRQSSIARRSFLRSLLGAAVASALVGVSRSANAAGPLVVAVPHIEVAAVAKAVGGSHVRVDVDDSLAPDAIRVGDDVVSLKGRVMLKGKGVARRRFLDDPRNAPKLGAAIRDALSKAQPSHANAFADNHKAWSRPFARRVLKWQAKLAKSSVRGKKVRDDHGRRYLLEWAGATVHPRGGLALLRCRKCHLHRRLPLWRPMAHTSTLSWPRSADLAASKTDETVDRVLVFARIT